MYNLPRSMLNGQVDMMKRNLSGMVPQLAMGMVVNFFFNGFVMGKVPFALSPRFKPMLQVGKEEG